jgi:hypothetical protein
LDNTSYALSTPARDTSAAWLQFASLPAHSCFCLAAGGMPGYIIIIIWYTLTFSRMVRTFPQSTPHSSDEEEYRRFLKKIEDLK